MHIPHKFRLYIAGDAPNSTQAVGNLKALCAEFLPHGHEIEIVDMFREPKRALADGVLLTPTLVRVYPTPKITILGTLADLESVLVALKLADRTISRSG